ncbi:hypothetical protein FNV43_RR23713 [Rhamnella rubrinervis]|uniref:Uncharacterized protein n=1 Tax=Rhamnella rubrinervis TaxID=2594499 RepID=A0A8K0DXN0_9ROSA|nr:hypothetical protein FNV43_RR23713 [Rhamnella rubrinervis]
MALMVLEVVVRMIYWKMALMVLEVVVRMIYYGIPLGVESLVSIRMCQCSYQCLVQDAMLCTHLRHHQKIMGGRDGLPNGTRCKINDALNLFV